MSDGLYKYNEQLEEERQRESIELLKKAFAEWLNEAEKNAGALTFWLWFKQRKNVIERQKELIDILK